jgi:hypothetical protein
MIEKPIITVARRVIGLLTAIWMPATNIKDPLKNNAAPITGRGMSTIMLANCGRHESTISQAAIDQATARLVTPVVFSSPTRLGLALIPGVPNAPPAAHPIPSAMIPAEILVMSGRRQAESLSCWHVVNTPTTRKPEASPAIAKGNIKDGSKP